MNFRGLLVSVKNALKVHQGLADEDGDVYWLSKIEEQLREWDSVISRYFYLGRDSHFSSIRTTSCD